MGDNTLAERLDSHAETLRKMWQHEDTIANHRLTWFNTTQGLLFAALALVLRDKVIVLKPILVAVGLGSCILTFISVQLGAHAKAKLQDCWEKLKDKHSYVGPPVVGFYMRPGSLLGYLAPSNLLPVLFGGAWLFVFWI